MMALAQPATQMALDLDEDRKVNRYSSVHSSQGSQVDFTYGRPNYAMKGSQSLLRPVKDKVRSEVKKRRLRLEEFFQPFDFQHNKKVSEVAFLRALGASGIDLTSSELRLLINRYKVPGGDDAIDYQKFCDQSNKVFTCKGLERAPGKNPERNLEATPTVLGAENPTLTPLEKARTVEMLEEMRRNVSDIGIIVKNLFKQFDLHGNGCVSGEQFLRVISCHGLLSADKVLNMEHYGHVLVKAFTQRADGPGLEAVLVNYKALHDQLMADEHWNKRVVEAKPALLIDRCPEEYHVPTGDESEGERLERLLVEEAVARRIEVLDYFYTVGGVHATDTNGATRISSCSRERFKQLLRGLWRAHFTDEQVMALAERFLGLGACPSIRRASNTVDLAAFARHLSKRILAVKKRVVAAGGRKTRPGGGGVVAPPRMSKSEAEDVENVVLDIKAKIKRERINLKPTFKSFDPRNELVVANEQFCRVLSTQGLLPFDARLRELLTRRYAVSDFRRQTTVHQGFVAYLEFLEDVDAPLATEGHAYIDNFVFGRDQSLDSDGKSESPSSTITPSPSNPTTLSRVGGETLAANLRSAASLTSEALMGRRGIGCNPTRDCDAVLCDVRRRTMRERVRIMDLFQDFDRLQHGTCTQAQLARVMKTLDHALTDTELAAVCKRYQKKTPNECSPGDGTRLIDYKRLVSDVEAVFTVKDLERKSTTIVVGEEVREARDIERRLRGESSRVEKLTPEEEKMLAKFLRELAMKVNKDSLCLSSLFTDFDRLNIGDITEGGMERALGRARLLPPEPIFRAMVKKFREHSRHSSGSEVNYKAFIAAVELAQDPLRTPRDLPNATRFRAIRADGAADDVHDDLCSPAPPADGGVMTPRALGETLRSALSSIGKQLSLSNCQLKDFLAYEDTLNTGEVTCTAMRHCFVLAGVRLTSPELMALDKAFRSPTRPETIAWQDLCRAVVGPTTGKLGGTSTTAASDQSSSRCTASDWKEEELLLKIGGEIKTRNPNLEDLFKAYDRSKRGTVTEAHFFSVLNQGLPRIHLTTEDVAILARLLVDCTGCDFGGQVRYKNFLEAVRC